MALDHLWWNPEIDGFAARVGLSPYDLILDEGIDLNPDMTAYGFKPEGIIAPQAVPIWHFNVPREIHAFVGRCYAEFQPRPDGVWTISPAGVTPSLLAEANNFLMQVVHHEEIGVVLGKRNELRFDYRTMRARLIAEVCDDFRRKPPYARCAHCDGWFPRRRKDRLVCSGRCQTAYWRRNQGE